MLSKIKELVYRKKVLILGFGKEGRSTFNVLKQAGGFLKLDIADKSEQGFDIKEGHTLITGNSYMDSLDEYDVVFKSPGIVLPKNLSEYICLITSQTDIFLSVYGRQTIGITGTKGKSTVSSLIYHTLNANGIECLLAGNIGTPVFDIASMITQKTVIVFELSCHQLEYCKHSPSISILLNIYEDHLDHYKSFESYSQAKTNIYRNQFALDFLYCNPDFLPEKSSCASRVVPVTKSILPFERLEIIDDVKLRGAHNLLNCAFVFSVCKTFGISAENFIKALQTFEPLAHRLEFIGNKNGVDYYDDSISTTVESAISAIKSIHNAGIILLGGMDRGIDYSALVEFLPQSGLTHVILMYESGKKIYNMLQNNSSCKTVSSPEFILVPDLYTAAETAQKHAISGTACILSPAAASYGDFKNFEERGNVFKELIFNKV